MRVFCLLLLALFLLGCGPDAEPQPTPAPEGFCASLGLPALDWSNGPYGDRRTDLADDFTLPTQTGDWRFRKEFTGCESYTFIPYEWPVSDLDASSIWEEDENVARLLEEAPANAQFFFANEDTAGAVVGPAAEAMQARIDAWLGANVPPKDRDSYRRRFHVVSKSTRRLDSWVKQAMTTTGRGFAIDRFQRIRGLGNFADPTRFDPALSNAGYWPWKQNLAYALHENQYYNYEAERQQAFDADGATVVRLFDHQAFANGTEVTVDLPDAAAMAGFDTLIIDIEMECPTPGAAEVGDCGPWDYKANLMVYDTEADAWYELGRFITTYHRAARYAQDVSPLLALLAQGGTRTFRMDPSWQTYTITLDLRFSNTGKGYHPTEATWLWGTRNFNASYNENRDPVTVSIPSSAKHVEFFAYITGHGMDTNNCAEFCDHQHEFTVNGQTQTFDQPDIGDDEGCAKTVGSGTVPNQNGTWFFGRGGWCPGRQVDPTIWDVTDLVTLGGDAVLSYRGLYAGQDPPPANSGEIWMSSWLVISE